MDNFLNIELGVKTPEEYTDGLVKNKTVSEVAIENYSELYHRLFEATVNDDKEEADRIRDEINNLIL